MPTPRDPTRALKLEVTRLEARLAEAEATLDAMRQGHADALVVGDQVYTLEGTGHRYRQLVETMNEGALLLTGDGIIVYANARFAAMVNRPLERIIGAPMCTLAPPVWQPLLEAFVAGRGGNDPKVELELVVADEGRVPVYLSATASWDRDEALTSVIATDLTDQKRSHEMVAAERLTSMIIDQAAEGVVVCDLSGRVIRASRIAHGVATGNPLLRPFGEGFPLLAAGTSADRLLALALEGETINGLEVSLPRDGDDVHLLLSAGPVLGPDGVILGCVISFVDVTDRRRAAEERLRWLDHATAARVEAETANRAKDEFLAMLGHELRNPLAPILTTLELMRMRGGGALLREREVIERHVHHMVRLVDDLLDVSRITQGNVTLTRGPIELVHVIGRAIEAATPLLEERHHQIAVEIPTGLWVDGDEMRLRQVVVNLLTNAARYTLPGGHIRISASGSTDEVVVRVRDDGIGMSPELLATVFERFVQGKRGSDRSEGGLGLGLAIVRSLVSLHGGTVAARSEGTGHGSELEVRLPRLATPAAGASSRISGSVPALEAASEIRRVLIVDDNVDAAEILAETLAMLGHDTRVAFDGPQALDVAAEFVPDIAFLDIGLPEMDGYELAGRMRHARAGAAANLRLVALTGYGQESDRQRAMDAGFDRHLVKPINIGAIESVIRSLVGVTPP